VLSIERRLRKASPTLHAKYTVLADRLLTHEYEHWAAKFPFGNNHGPSHIKRVLENLDQLLGKDPLAKGLLNAYELFLTMMSVLYHDVGILGERETHADISASYIHEEKNEYIFDERDRAIIEAAVVSHSSSKEIERECAQFAEVETIGSETVRPRVVAALVRLADELDEDYRRADPNVASKLGVDKESEFYWQFCQRILGVQPDPQMLEIHISVKFKKDDVGRTVRVKAEVGSFLSHFAHKLAKINRERASMARFLPQRLRYRRLVVSVKALESHPRWKKPREFIFNDDTTASEFVAAVPELSKEPAALRLTQALESIRKDDPKAAIATLKQVEDVLHDQPPDIVLRILYDRACAESRLAERSSGRANERKIAIDLAFQYLKRWYELGLSAAWGESGRTPENEVFRMGSDRDLHYLLSTRRTAISRMIGLPLNKCLPDQLPKPVSSPGGGGCVPLGTMVRTPGGSIPIQALRIGWKIASVDTSGKPRIVVARVLRVHCSREARVIQLNRRSTFTPSQRLYLGQSRWIHAEDVKPGIRVIASDLRHRLITDVRQIRRYCEVYTLTTDHPSHNFLAHGLICANKYYLE